MPARFYAPDAERAGDVVALPRDEAEHLVRVLRLKAGSAVRVFNGRGAEFDAVVESVPAFGAHVRLHAPRASASELRVAITLAQAILKGDKMDDVVRDAVMMGVAAIQPIVATRSEVTLASLRRGHRRERWQRIAVASAKQCGRAVVPAVLEPLAFDEVISSPGAGPDGQVLMFVEPSAAADVVTLGALGTRPPQASTILVGPEGGWTPDEIAGGAAHQWLTLGRLTLRADAMAVVALTALLTHWREL